MTDVTELSEVKVWYIPPKKAGDQYYHEWSISGFVESTRLIPTSCASATSGMGSASFRVLLKHRAEVGTADLLETIVTGNEQLGAYVAITNAGTEFDHDNVIFYGYINQLDLTESREFYDGMGTASAIGLGQLLDTSQLDVLAQAVSGGSLSDAETSATFNIQGKGGEIVGNKVSGGSGEIVLASLPSECAVTSAKTWSRWEMVKHVSLYSKPSGLPTIDLTAESAVVTYLSLTTKPEIFKVDGLTLRGAIDLGISKAHGFAWKLWPKSNGNWEITAYAMSDSSWQATTNDVGYPKATAEDADLTGLAVEALDSTQDASQQYDAVTVEGSPILFGLTLSCKDQTLVAGWETSQETLYRAGASGDAGYDDLSSANKKSRNEQVRNGAALQDVFSLFKLKTTSRTPVRSATPGTGAGSLALIPEILWTGTAASVGISYRIPYYPTLRFSRSVPWPIGRGGSTDSRTAAQKAAPQYPGPRCFSYVAEPLDGQPVCVDLDIPVTLGSVSRGNPSVSIDDRSPGVRVSFSPNEFLAKASWSDDDDGIGRIASVENDTTGAVIDYLDNLCVTVGIPSQQKVSVTKIRSGVPDNAARRRLIVTDETLSCWVCLAGTIVGTKADGTADRVSSDTFIRNDFAAAEHLCLMVAQSAFKSRRAVRITMAEPETLPSWARIGAVIGDVLEESDAGTLDAVYEAGTMVESIAYTFGDSPRVTISTEPPRVFTGNGSAGPTSGGAISQSLGGTVAQATQDNQKEICQLKQDTASMFTSVPKSIGTPVTFNTVMIDKGNTLDTGQDGINYFSGSKDNLPSAYDPNVTSTFVDGIGRGTLYVNGVAQAGYVLVVNDNHGSFQNALISGDVIFAGGPISVTVSGGGVVSCWTAG